VVPRLRVLRSVYLPAAGEGWIARKVRFDARKGLVSVLEITPGALVALKDLRTRSDIPDDADARIQAVTGEGGEGIGLTFVEEGEENDQVVAEEGDFKIVVAGELADALDESVLDIRATEAGVQLELRERHPGISPNEQP
jgi:Fe-S cluster assembly iron-binding protein IscA